MPVIAASPLGLITCISQLATESDTLVTLPVQVTVSPGMTGDVKRTFTVTPVKLPSVALAMTSQTKAKVSIP